MKNCISCRRPIHDDDEVCGYCGAVQREKDVFVDTGAPSDVPHAVDAGVEEGGSPPAVRCPKCGGTDCVLVHRVSERESDSMISLILWTLLWTLIFGPTGLLCGLLGVANPCGEYRMRTVRRYYACRDCGHRFV